MAIDHLSGEAKEREAGRGRQGLAGRRGSLDGEGRDGGEREGSRLAGGGTGGNTSRDTSGNVNVDERGHAGGSTSGLASRGAAGGASRNRDVTLLDTAGTKGRGNGLGVREERRQVGGDRKILATLLATEELLDVRGERGEVGGDAALGGDDGGGLGAEDRGAGRRGMSRARGGRAGGHRARHGQLNRQRSRGRASRSRRHGEVEGAVGDVGAVGLEGSRHGGAREGESEGSNGELHCGRDGKNVVVKSDRQ